MIYNFEVKYEIINPELSKVILGLKRSKISSFEYNKKNIIIKMI